jgi:hypothetical protein
LAAFLGVEDRAEIDVYLPHHPQRKLQPGGNVMSRTHLMLTALFLAIASTAPARATTWYVNGVSGSDSNRCLSATTACKTIGHAISRAHSGDSIMIAPSTYTENLSIGISLNLIGSGASKTIIDGLLAGIVVTIVNSSDVTVSNLTIRNGSGGGIVRTLDAGGLSIISSVITGNRASSCQGADGGGISNYGTLTITNSTISGNQASATCVGAGAAGGGIFNNVGPVTINQSTISGNSVSAPGCFPNGFHSCIGGFAYGGGIAPENGAIMIINSTIAGNATICHFGGEECKAYGGGIWVEDSSAALLTISSSTFSGNSAVCNSKNCIAGAGGITSEILVPAVMQNSIVANNSGGRANCDATITSNGYNLSSDKTCNFNGPGDLNNTDPMLGPLQNNGGPTQTQALLTGSPAIDAGNPSGCTDGNGHLLKTDQRGMPRPDKEDTGGCDMGAYERQSD